MLSPPEQEIVFSLAEKLTGSSQKGGRRKTVLVQNVERRLNARGLTSLAAYLQLVESDADEFQALISALTIHFTSWFREIEHFSAVFAELGALGVLKRNTPLRVLSAACSSGEEVYSLAFFLQAKKEEKALFDFEIVGIDIDHLSIKKAKKAVYPASSLSDIPRELQRFVNLGRGHAEGFFAVDSAIRARTRFYPADLREVGQTLKKNGEQAFDVVICRNALIYFDEVGVAKVIQNLRQLLGSPGLLCLGHSEGIDAKAFGLRARGRSIYATPETVQALSKAEAWVLVIDDSAVIRRILCSLLDKSGFGSHAVASAREADVYLRTHAVDLVTLDLRMPEVDGATWLRQVRSKGFKAPIVICSDASPAEVEDVLAALSEGAQDFIEKKLLSDSPHQIVEKLKCMLKSHSGKDSSKVTVLANPGQAARKLDFRPDLIVVGASTGGTEALVKLLPTLPAGCPPVMVVQHIPEAFSAPFARRLAATSGLTLAANEQGKPLLPHHLYMALGDFHIGVKRQKGQLCLDILKHHPEHSVRPAVDVLFRTAAASKARCVGILLTGMGRDGALGLLSLKNSGSFTLVQDESSCAVFGMPREAIEVGAAHLVGNLVTLRQELDKSLAVTRVA